MSKAKQDLEYELADGSKVPLFEADYDLSFICRRKDQRGAIVGDPRNCVEAKAMCRMDGVIEAYVGTGKDAYVIFRATRTRPFIHALHFTIPADAARVRDRFDTKKTLKTQTLMLKVPSKGRTLKHRRKLGKERAKAVKAGASVKKRGTIAAPRVQRIGAAHRPRARIIDGVVTLSHEVEQTSGA